MSGVYAIKVRQAGRRRFEFVSSRGGISANRIHAGLYDSVEIPTALLAAIVADHDHIIAAKVVDFANHRDVPGAFVGLQRHPTDQDLLGYRYLRSVSNSTPRGTFHILDPETGDFLDFDETAYEACVAEALRAGAHPSLMTVYAKTATFSTDGVTFVQQDFAF